MNWSTMNKVGLALLGIAAIANFIPPPEVEGVGPPTGVLIAGAVLGAIALVAVVVAWRKGSRTAALVAVGVSILNAMLAVPAFFVDGVPTSVRILVGIFIAWTAVAVALTLASNRERA